MFDFLKGGKARVTLELERTGAGYYPGETVRAKVTVVGEKDLKIQQGRVTLVYKEEYQYRHETERTDSDGRRERREAHTWQTDEIEVQKKVFLGEGTIKAGAQQSFEFELPMPGDAVPSCGDGRIVRVTWHVKATLDRKMAADVEEKSEIFVLSVAPGQAVGAGEYGYSNSPGDAELVFALSGKEFVLGGRVEGQLLVRPKKAFDASEVRVELVRREYVPRNLGNEHLDQVVIKVAGGTKLEPGQDLKYPFVLQVPGGGAGTIRTRNSSVTWTLKGILSRRMRGDTQVAEEVFVYNVYPQGG
ncbi:MAG: sporulation protein [Chloroflexi bacterium]|nr:sporulation protein [Chloroflexota bacterium]